MNNNDVNYMKRALQLAIKGAFTVAPNPMVGALVVKNGVIIGEGFHERKGLPHAEVNAIKNSNQDVSGATLYCTLEPCCHTNKTTPPCTDLIISMGIKRVVVAATDPNPLVAGQGFEILKRAGIEVVSGVLKEEAEKQNFIFFKNMRESLPFLKIKTAITLDGKVCSQSGDSKWISSASARSEVHRDRGNFDAIMIGVKTLRNDNPRLNTRDENNVIKENKKIIIGDLIDSDLELGIFKSNAQIINIFNKTSFETPNILSIPKQDTWNETLKSLYAEGVTSIYAEGGSQLVSSLIKEKVYDHLTLYIAQKVIGNGKSFYEDDSHINMDQAISLNGKWRINENSEAILEVRK